MIAFCCHFVKCVFHIVTQLMENYYTRQGYTFTRWNTRIDGTGTSYSDKAGIVTNESITLYAQWKVDHLTAPTISSQPVGTDLTEGYEDAYALSITASSPSEDAITYQWYSNTTDSSTGGTLIPGETNAGYTISTNLSVGTYYYYCEVSSTRGTETLTTKTGVATVTVREALVTPTIDTEPVDLNLTEGNTTGSTLTVAASCATAGATLSYQWYSTPTGSTSDGTLISGATSASYDPASLTVGYHYYYCIVTATRSTETQSTTSRVAKITVASATVPSSGNYSYYEPAPASGNYSYNKPTPASGNHSYNEPAPEPKFPGGEGWTGIVNEIGNITEGGQLEINMNGTTNLPSTVTETIKGKDINIVLDMGNGIKWTINGKDVTDSSKNTNMAVSLNSSLIPVDVINNLNKEHYTMQISLAQKGSFGFKATLTLPMRTQDAGLSANMFRYTKNVLKQSSLSIAANDASTPTGEFEFISAGRIAEDGSVNLEFDGTDGVGESTTETALAIIVDDHSLDPNIKPTPLTLKAASKAGKVTLSWNKVVGATKYRIYQKIGKKFKMLSEKKNNKLTIKKAYKTVMKKGKKKTELKKLIIGQKYTFAVKAYVDGKWQKITVASTKDVKIS